MRKLFLLMCLCCMSFAAWSQEYQSYIDENQLQWTYYINDATSPEYITVTYISVSNPVSELVFPDKLPYNGGFYPVKEVKCTYGNGIIGDYNTRNAVTSIKLPSELTSISDWDSGYEGSAYQNGAFYDFAGLQSITIPASLTTIGQYAFYGCYGLETIYVEATTPPATFSPDAFSYSMRPKRFIVPSTSLAQYKASEGWKDYVYCAEELVDYTYTDANGVTWTYRLDMTNSAARVVAAANYTTELVFPSVIPHDDKSLPITYVEFGISNNENLITVDLSATQETSVRMSGGAWGGIRPNLSFHECPSLQTVIFPSTLVEIGNNAFYNCPNLQTINWTDLTALKKIEYTAFASDWEHRFTRFTTIDLSSTQLEAIGNSAFANLNNLQEIKFPASLKSIGAEAFNGCQLRSVDLSHTAISTIESRTFSGCGNLQSIALPTSLKEISKEAFNNDYQLNEIDLSNVEIIGERAFNGCHNLDTIDLSAATSIGLNAFTSDMTVTINSSVPASIKANSFTENTKFIVTSDAYDTFCAAAIWSNWEDNISMYNIDADGVKWIYRYLKDSNSMCITSASGYGKQVVVPSSVLYKGTSVPVTHIEGAFGWAEITSVVLPTTLTHIGDGAFQYSQLSSINIPASVTSIGSRAFQSNNNLKSVTFEPNSALDSIGVYAFAHSQLSSIIIPASVKNIGSHAFQSNNNLTSVTFEPNSALDSIGVYAFAHSQLSSIIIPASVKNIGTGTFQYCYSLCSINLSQVETIGDYAFQGCNNLTSIDLSNAETIGDYAFSGVNITSADLSSATSIGANAFYDAIDGGTYEPFFKINNTTPATLLSGAFPSNSMFLVPGSAVATYKSANVWSEYASRIFASNVAVQTINVTAQANGSGVLDAIGGSINQTNIIDLTVKGTINGYDFVMFKDKMLNLRYLDLSEAEIVYNPYRYYEYNYSQNDTLGAYAFNQENKLISIKLPKTIKHIGNNAFSGCTSLSEVVFGDKLESVDFYAFSNCQSLTSVTIHEGLKTLGSDAFSGCSNLSEVTLPNTVTRIDYNTFSYCYNLKEFTFPNQLEYIGGWAFVGTGLKEVTFPSTLKTISGGAFQSCNQLETVRIPSSLQYVYEGAFQWCNNLKHVYTYTIEPTDINENTFSNFETAMLYVPKASGQNYYWDEGWKRFLNIMEFDEEYTYFYLNGDHTLDESTGAVDGAPGADLNAGSGLIVEEEVEQNMSDLNIHHDGTCGGSIIAGSTEGNVNAENLHVHINVQSGRWYFFCFPFDLKKENISMGKEETQYVFRCYDGSKRAEGNSGWKNVTEEEGRYLKAATGYIFQCSQSDVLTLSLANVKFKKENKYNELVAHTAANLQDASWNFVGNPYLSYYDMADVGYDAPITVWNGSSYEAIRPGDDDYKFAPFEAFFVQKPEDTANMEFDGNKQTTHKGGNNNGEPARVRRRTRAVNPDRLLVNITITDGQNTDRTRIVFNDEVSMGYELSCDAAKFEAAGVPQLYTIDSRAVKYAINERPVAEGIVTLGFSAPIEGNYTLAVPRMDTPISIKDNLTGIVHDFAEGDYTFMSESGTFEDRFTVIMKAGETSIDNGQLTIDNAAPVYNTKGQKVEDATEQGIYIKNNRKVVNL